MKLELRLPITRDSSWADAIINEWKKHSTEKRHPHTITFTYWMKNNNITTNMFKDCTWLVDTLAQAMFIKNDVKKIIVETDQRKAPSFWEILYIDVF